MKSNIAKDKMASSEAENDDNVDTKASITRFVN